jgi:putative hydrolase of HD superfamily
MNPEQIITFVDFLGSFTTVKRATKIKGKNDFENDAEHSYQVALTAWYIVDVLKLEVNKQLILEYALAHDLVETYAGDTDVFNRKIEHAESKHNRENQAKDKIKENFPDFISLHKSIDNYEKLDDYESKLIYIVDKILPWINVYLSDDRYYKNNGITREEWEKWIRSKIDRAGMQDIQILSIINGLIQFQKGRDNFYCNCGE